ncbi:MAG: autotransporter-associated beta strand repeat-containing protein, partial [Verrucomicrobia bacterium]|nr:autotransporter-associated beta strand repeat-containing protein [Verrucomicrobiota bacterium]
SLRISKTGGTLTSDLVTGMTGVTYNGTLQVTNVTSDSSALALGDTFTLFTSVSGSYANGFANFILPPLPGGLSWDISQLTVNGQISVSALTATPTFSPTAGGYVGAQAVTISSLTAGATIYYTTDGSTPTLSSPSGPNGLTILVPAPTANMTIQAFAHLPGSTDSGIASASYRTVVTPAWVNPAGGSWPTAENWSNSIVADGSGMTADFSTLALPADTTVTLDGARTIGKLVFDDRNATRHSWTLTADSAGPLTLAVGSGAPVISNNVPVTLDVGLVGTQGLTKTGPATNTISGTVSYTGDTTVDNGRLVLQSMSTSWGNGGTVSLASGGTLEFNLASDWTPALTTMGVTGTGTFLKSGAGMMDVMWQFSAGFVMNLNTNALIDVQAGILRFGWGFNNGSNSWSGNKASLHVAQGAVFDTWDYNAIPVYVDALTGSGTVQHGSSGTGTLTVGVAGGSGTFNGTIQNGNANTVMALTKTGGGTQILAGNNTYTGPTVVSNGTLTISGQLTASAAVTVDDGATLNVASAIAIKNATNLTLGVSGPTTLGFSGLASTLVAPITVATLVANGPVTVNVGGSLSVGQFPLIKYTNSASGLGNFVLGTLPAGTVATLVNNTANQSVDVNVTTAVGPPGITVDLSSGTNYLYAGRAYSLSVVAGGSAPLHYQWQKNGVPISGANTATLSLTSVTPSDTGGYSVTVTNTLGTAQSATNHLVVLTSESYDDQITAYWPLNELNGSTAFDYAGTDNATYSGSLTLGVPGIATGDFDTAVNFTGGTATAPYSDSLNPAIFTIEFWCKPNDLTSAYVVALQDRTTGSRIGYAIQKNNFTSGWDFTFGTGPASYSTISSGTAVVAGSVYYVAATYDGTTARLYVNGVLTSSLVTTYQPANPGAVDFTMGSRNGNTAMNGVLEDVRVYSRALTAEEISALAFGGPPAKINTTPTSITTAVSGGQLTLSWPADHTGWTLQSQTNLSSRPWYPVSGSSATNSMTIPIDPTKPTVFYRLVYP